MALYIEEIIENDEPILAVVPESEVIDWDNVIACGAIKISDQIIRLCEIEKLIKNGGWKI